MSYLEDALLGGVAATQMTDPSDLIAGYVPQRDWSEILRDGIAGTLQSALGAAIDSKVASGQLKPTVYRPMVSQVPQQQKTQNLMVLAGIGVIAFLLLRR